MRCPLALLLALLLPLLLAPPAAGRARQGRLRAPADSSSQPLNRTDRVVGGSDVAADSVKWVASLQYRTSNMHFCGATVLNDYWVLTAAHCMVGNDKDKFQVVTGGTDLDDAGLQVRLPAKVVIADYDSTEKFNDLALIKTVEPLRPSTRLSGEFMQLAKGRPSDGTACLVLGWGTTRSGGSTVRRLQMALVTTQSRDRCAEAYRAQHYNIYDTMLCAGGGARDACQGDSGGPLHGRTSDVCYTTGAPR
ncbi:trypsin theta-like [Pollicipes pollicipes]|uniref:trypsin theta-like n=1 Tax=Pollicipes pollicipes TaxID=41117 RepID=UPI0018852C87|nr:trypsin theta-like [Pollicipes pollicipes]